VTKVRLEEPCRTTYVSISNLAKVNGNILPERTRKSRVIISEPTDVSIQFALMPMFEGLLYQVDGRYILKPIK
jgi:hypothetical protein